MSGDYSKHGFDPNKDYSGVLMQQGRVQLDSDWNEQVEIQDRRLRAETADIVGRCGVPQETPDGFKIELPAGVLTIGQGRIYVDGLLVENHGAVPRSFDTLLAELRGTASLPYDEQPYLLQPRPLPTPTTGMLLFYVDVWQREVTLLKDPELLEKAVGVDTTTRLQTVWQVRFLQVGADVTCATPVNEISQLHDATQPSAGRLSTDAIGVDPAQDPCVIPPSGGFRGLENRLYRVEIHKSEPVGTATFKWSANNAVLTTAVTVIDPSTRTELTVETTRKDSVLQFQVGDWVEIKDDAQEFALQPGEMRKIADVDHGTGTITLEDALPVDTFPTDSNGNTDSERHTRLRQWHQKGQILDGNGDVIDDVDANGGVILLPAAADPAISIQLNDGVIATFETDPVGDEFRVGDYWNFAARTADASVEKLIKAPPRGIHHHYCRLALLEAAESEWVVRDDCRTLFPPLTRLIHFYYVSGDGQEVMPDLTTDSPQVNTALELVVGVEAGGQPLANVTVRFSTLQNIGLVNGQSGSAEITTSPDGRATCAWLLDANEHRQQVEARLLGPDAASAHIPIIFNANLSLAEQVAYRPNPDCPHLANEKTVQDALDKLCARGCAVTVGKGGQFPTLKAAVSELLADPHNLDICLCLLPGDHPLPQALSIDKSGVRLQIHGCGRGTRLIMSAAMTFKSLEAVTIEQLALQSTRAFGPWLDIRACRDVKVMGCHFSGRVKNKRAVLANLLGERFHLENNTIEAYPPTVTSPTRILVDTLSNVSNFPDLADLASGFKNLFNVFAEAAFIEGAAKLSQELVNLKPRTRKTVKTILSKKIVSDKALTGTERVAYSLFANALKAKQSTDVLQDALDRIRIAAVEASESIALIIDDKAEARIVNNEVIGVISAYGTPTKDWLTSAQLKDLPAKLQPPLFEGSGRNFLLCGNRLTRLVVSSDMVQLLQQLASQNEIPVTELFNSSQITDNRFTAEQNQFVAGHIAMKGNVFEAPPNSKNPLVGTAIGTSAYYTANAGAIRNNEPFSVFRNVAPHSNRTTRGDLNLLRI